ncbi:hypothetical protein KAU39_03930 [bacterium]|nr:hypothetical protein [bacterium]
MKVEGFINACVENGYHWYQGEHEGKDGYFVGSKELNTVAHFLVEAIQQNEWPILENQITQGKKVHHVSRVVGYFSRIENWNKSKHGELKDRNKGDYGIK